MATMTETYQLYGKPLADYSEGHVREERSHIQAWLNVWVQLSLAS